MLLFVLNDLKAIHFFQGGTKTVKFIVWHQKTSSFTRNYGYSPQTYLACLSVRRPTYPAKWYYMQYDLELWKIHSALSSPYQLPYIPCHHYTIHCIEFILELQVYNPSSVRHNIYQDNHRPHSILCPCYR